MGGRVVTAGIALLVAFAACTEGDEPSVATTVAAQKPAGTPGAGSTGQLPPEVTIDFLRGAIAATEERAAMGTEPLQPLVSNPLGPIAEEGPSVDSPPPGAARHLAPHEQDIELHQTGASAIERDRSKASPEEGDPPLPPPDWRHIGFSSGIVELQPGIDERLLGAAEQIADRDFTFALVVLDQYLTETVEATLASAGVDILGPHGSAYRATVPIDAEKIEEVASLPFVYWIGYPDPELKLDGAFSAAWEEYGDELAALPVLINLFGEFDEHSVSLFGDELRDREIVVGPYHPLIGAFEAVVPLDQVSWLIGRDFILFVELQTPIRPALEASAAVMGADYIRPGGTGATFSGASTIVGILDSGFMVGSAAATMHDDLDKYACGRNFSWDSADVWNDEWGHGTRMLSIIGGTGTADPEARGMAIGIGSSASARIRAAKIYHSKGHGLPGWYEDGMRFLAVSSACGSGAPHVINLSGGRDDRGRLGTDNISRELDARTFHDKQAYVVSAGNQGEEGLLAPGTAKNAITVGNVQTEGFQRIGVIAADSSRGPTTDKRMKPNVVATGSDIDAAEAGTSDGYDDDSGTSSAAAHVTGIAATLLENHEYLRGRPYLLRALLMATAILHNDETTPSHNSYGGRNTYGLGRVSSYISHWSRPDSNGWNTYVDWETVTDSSWGSLDIEVPEDTQRLVVVTTWDEDAAGTHAVRAVEYDLDLWIDYNADCTPDSKGQCGEWASQSWIDNVEYLIIDNPPAGTHRLKIVNWSAPSSGLPVGLVATAIRGDPTPNISLFASASDLTPEVGDTVDITATVSGSAYVASGVHLELEDIPDGIVPWGVGTRREDGVNMYFPGGRSLSLGSIAAGDSRSAEWTVEVNTSASTTIKILAWSENGGGGTTSITIDPHE